MKTLKQTLLATMVTFGLAGLALAQQPEIDQFRLPDKDGVNVFEAPKTPTKPFDGVKIRMGGAFTQQYQALQHSNSAAVNNNAQNVNLNGLMPIGYNFNTATANWTMDVQFAEGVRMNLTTYLSSRHHNEAWVKGGFMQFDALPFLPFDFVGDIMQYVTIKVGHMETNYGDAHFRRTDNGNAMYNPFVGNYIMDAFTTEIGAEVYVQHNGYLAMVAITNGEINGNINYPERKGPAYYLKGGFDKQIDTDLRVRLTGSMYHTVRSSSNTLYGGDRAGSRYYFVMENTLATAAAQFTSGRFNPGFRSALTAFVINPFIKYQGLEFFGNVEFASGRAANETKDRSVAQYAGELIYRFGQNEDFFVGGRYNTVSGALQGAQFTEDVTINRIQIGGGWFMTKNVMAKVEYVNQSYDKFPSSDIRHKGNFNGFMVEAVIGF